jgi:hypothetical protein
MSGYEKTRKRLVSAAPPSMRAERDRFNELVRQFFEGRGKPCPKLDTWDEFIDKVALVRYEAFVDMPWYERAARFLCGRQWR